MRKQLLAAGLLVIGFASCRKQEVTVNEKQYKPPYRISGLSDMLLTRSPFAQLPQLRQYLNVFYESGNQKQVTLGITGLPAGLTDSFGIRNGYPDFSTVLDIKDAGALTGVYPAQLTLKAEGDSLEKRFPFTITVKGSTSCTDYFVGKTYTTTNSCSGTTQTYEVSVSRQSSNSDTLLLNNLLGTGEELKAIFNCDVRSFRSYPQLVGNNYYSALGGTIISTQLNVPDRILARRTEFLPGGASNTCPFELIAK